MYFRICPVMAVLASEYTLSFFGSIEVDGAPTCLFRAPRHMSPTDCNCDRDMNVGQRSHSRNMCGPLLSCLFSFEVCLSYDDGKHRNMSWFDASTVLAREGTDSGVLKWLCVMCGHG